MSQVGRLVIGAMSGTSADGVDVAVVRVDGRGVEVSARLVQHHHESYPAGVRKLIFAAREDGAIAFSDLARIGREISLTYVLATKETLRAAKLDVQQIVGLAAHGQ